MKSLSEYIVQQIRYVAESSSWHAPTDQLLSGVTAEQAIWRPAEGGHTIYEIVNHLAYSAREVASRCRGNAGKWEEDQSWVTTPSTLSQAEWESKVEELKAARRDLCDVLASMDNHALLAPIREDYTLLAQALQIVHHEAFHAGQIAYLRRLQGLEPVM